MNNKQKKRGQAQSSWRWTVTKSDAALAVALAEETEVQISERLGVSRRQLQIWKTVPAFQSRVREEVDRICQAIRSSAIAVPERRVQMLQRQYDRMMRVIEERASGKRGGPGASTGLLNEGKLDARLLREIRQHLKQIAQELGQWTEHRDLTTAGGPIKVYRDVDDGEDVGEG